MSAERWLRLRELYDALSHVSPAERERLLNELCVDPDLRTEVLALLAADEKPDPFLTRTARRSAPLRPGAVLCDRFVIHRLLGKGGMGEVWAARDRQLEEDVAIKTIRPSHVNEAGGIARFKREIQLARRIAHPNVCRVHELFEDATATPPRLFLTMELLEGQTLSERLFEDGPLSSDAALEIVRQIAAGLAAAHEAGVVHRDLKPSNIMITAGASPGRVVLMDFGLARGPDTNHPAATTQVGALMGTPEYMAPEQISGAPPTPATDIYALGLILFEMLRGRPPFAADSTLESWMRRAREGPERLSGVVPGVQARIDSVIARCLEYEPSKRFQSAREVWDALQSPWPAVVARSRWPVLGAAAILVVMLVGLGAWSLVDRFRAVETPPAEALQWYDEAQRALAEGASVRALNDITRALAIAPRFPAAHAAHAEILLELDMPGRAQEAMLRATELAPNRSRLPPEDAAYLDGIQQLLLRNCDAAIGSLQRVANAARVPDRPYRLISVARAMERCGRTDDALAAFAEVIRLDPRNAAAPLRQARLLASKGEFDKATAALQSAEGLFRDRNNQQGVAEVLVARGMLERQRQQLDIADATLQKAADLARGLDDVRQQIRVVVQQAIVERERGRLSQTRELTRQAIETARQHNLETLTLDGLMTLGSAYLSGRELAEAVDLFETVLRIAEEYRHDRYWAWAQLSLGSAFIQMHDLDRAQKTIAAARPYYQRVGDVRTLAMADALQGQILMARGQFLDAIAQYSAAAAAAESKGDAEQLALALDNLATAQTGAGRYPEALAQFRRVLELRRASGRKQAEAFATANVADLLVRLGELGEAAELLGTVDALVPGNRDVASRTQQVLASLELARGDYAAALRAASMAVEIGKDFSAERTLQAQQQACIAHAALGRRATAVTVCDAALAAADAGPRRRLAWAESRLAGADAYLRLGDRRRAADLAREARSQLYGIPEYHERWKLLALIAAADGDTVEREAARTNLTRELDRLRLSWKKGGSSGEQSYASWMKRIDVASVVAKAFQKDGVGR